MLHVKNNYPEKLSWKQDRWRTPLLGSTRIPRNDCDLLETLSGGTSNYFREFSDVSVKLERNTRIKDSKQEILMRKNTNL